MHFIVGLLPAVIAHWIKYIAEQLSDECKSEYQARISEFNTREELDAWTRTLEDDAAELPGLDIQGRAAKKVIDISDELVKVVCPPFTILFGCLLTILIRAAALRGRTPTSCFSFVPSIHTASKRRQCPALA